jgi:hypothetical protein
MPERFPPPWSVTDTGTSWCVADAAGFKIVWFCYVGDGSVGTNPERMTREQAYAMAVNFARVPHWLGVR